MSDPISTDGDELGTVQTAFPLEAENPDESSGTTLVGISDYSDGNGEELDAVGDNAKWLFTLDYTMPADNVKLKIRIGDGSAVDQVGVEWRIDDNLVFTSQDEGTITAIDWRDENDGILGANGDGYDGPDLEPGTHEITAEVFSAAGTRMSVDILCVYDDRFNHDEAGTGNDFDNTVHQNNGYLNDPQLSPAQYVATLETVNTRRDLTEANVASTWNDTTNEQFVEVRIGSDSFDRSTNSTTASTTHSGTGDNSVDVQFGISRYPVSTGAQSATPRFGYNQQAIQTYELRGNPEAITEAGIGEANIRAIVSPGELDGDTLREAGALTTAEATLTRSVLADLAVGASQRIISSESNAFNND